MQYMNGFKWLTVFVCTNIMIYRMQNIEYPHHGQFRRTVYEIFKNDMWRPRICY